MIAAERKCFHEHENYASDAIEQMDVALTSRRSMTWTKNAFPSYLRAFSQTCAIPLRFSACLRD